MQVFGEADIEALLNAWPRLRRRPGERDDVCVLAGPFEFEAQPQDLPPISDLYRLRFEVPLRGPGRLLHVYEEGGRLRRDPDEHVNSDGSLCLGSPLRLRLLQLGCSDLTAYVEAAVVPFLYAASWRALGNSGYPFSELAHYGPGLTDDYGRLLRVQGPHQVARALALLASKRRLANKQPCPCGCSRRLGACHLHHHFNGLRANAPRSFWYHACAEFLTHNPLPPPPPKLRRRRRANRHRR